MAYFISYTSADKAWAKWVDWVLREHCKVDTIMQEYDFKSGNFRAHMNNALRDGNKLIAILSHLYMASSECRNEWTNVKDMNDIIPIRIDDVVPDGLLTNQIYNSLYDDKSKKAFPRDEALSIIKNCILGVDRPTEEPTYPGDLAATGMMSSSEPTYPGDAPAKVATKATENPAKPARHNLRERNPHFTGREGRLAEIAQKLRNVGIVVLQGMGGNGKTEIAVEYAHRHITDFTLIWSFNAASETTLQTDYRTFAAKILREQDPTMQFDILKGKVNDWLSVQTSCLLLYDNAEGYKDKLRDFLPTGLNGTKILICSREPIVGIVEPLSQKEFTLDEAVDYIQNRLEEVSRSDAIDLAKALDSLPLALECAVALILKRKYSIPQYLKEFSRSKNKLRFLATNPNDPNKTISTVWDTTFSKLSKRASGDSKAEAAVQLVQLCAYCAPDNIPLQLFVDGREQLPSPLRDYLSSDDLIVCEDVIDHLTDYALVTLSRNQNGNALLSMHRLMQEAAMESLKSDASAITFCLNVVYTVFRYEYGTPEEFDAFKYNAPHFAEIAGHVETLLIDDDAQEKVGWLYYNLGYGMMMFGEYDLALEWYNKGLAVFEMVLGKEHPDTGQSYNDIACIYHTKGEHDLALEWHFKALAICEKVLGMQHPYTGTSYNNIALVYSDKGEFDLALEWLFKALVICEKFLGMQHPYTGLSYNNIACVYHDKGEFDLALEWHFKALAICVKVQGLEHPDTGLSYSNIASVYRDKGEYDVALEWFYKAQVIFEKVLGKEHPDTIMIYRNIANCYKEKDDKDESAIWYRKAEDAERRRTKQEWISSK